MRNVRTSQHLLTLCNCFRMDIALWKLCATIGIAVKNFGANIMASTFGQAAQGKAQGRPPQLALLDSLAELTANFANEHMMELASRLAASLQDTSQGDNVTQLQRVRAGNLLQKNAYAFFHLASTEIGLVLRREIKALSAPPPDQRRRSTDAALSLVPFEEMDTQLAFESAGAPFDARHADQLALLGVRLAILLEWESMRPRQNPFRPQVIIEAINNAWTQFDPDSESHKLLLPLLTPALVFDLAPLYKSLNDALKRKGIEPGKAAPRQMRASDQPDRGPRAAEQTALARQLRRYFSRGEDDTVRGQYDSQGAGFGGQGGTVARPQASGALLAYLARIDGAPLGEGDCAVSPHNVFYLPRLKQTAPKGSLSQGEESTIDLLSKVFETVFADQAIPQEIRDLICFLQVPVLKAALRDKDFFFQEAHPARRMIDLLSRMGWEARQGKDDALFQTIARNVTRVERDVDGEAAVFAEAVSDLEAALRAEEQAFVEASADISRAALQQEKRTVAAKSAKSAIALRIGEGDVVAFIDSFLQDKWVQVMTIAYTVEDDKPGAVNNATRTMDDLIWSVKPKLTPTQRKELIGKLPGLLSTLNKWLDVIQWQDAERLQFFASLAECHASIVRAPLAVSPERQMELALEAAKQDAARKVEAARKQAMADMPEPEPFDASLAILERGMWFEFVEGAESTRVKLAWISPLRTLFIFSTASRKEAFSLPADALSEKLAKGSAKPMGPGVVGRALQDAMAEAAVNDPHIEGAA